MRNVVPAIVLALAACTPPSNNNNNNNNNPGTQGGSGSVSGLVMDSNTGTGIPDATVTSGTVTGKTDARGFFTLNGLASGVVTVTVAKDGFAQGYATPKIGDTGQSTLVTLKKEGAKQNFDNGAATLSEKTEAGPYAITFVAGSLDTTDTNLKVTITPVDPSKESQVLPGSLVTTSSSVLFPVTFAEFTILDSSGKKVQLKSGQSATVELPIPANMRAQYPIDAKIHCYAFNPATGAWDDFVDGTVRPSSVDGATPVLVAAIKHFSWYGGAPEGDNCQDVNGTVVSAVDGRPLGNARVEATPGGTTYTDANGNFTVVAAAGTGSKYFAYQTGFDVDGSLTGMAGAKYIEFGQVNEDLVGLVPKPCNAGAPAAANPPAGTRGGPDNRIKISVGKIGSKAYEAQVIVSEGQVIATLEEGVPDEDGDLIDKTQVGGAKISFSDGTNTAQLVEPAAGVGFYQLPAGGPLTITKGKTYSVAIDADANGSLEGQGTVSVVGDLAVTKPTAGATYPAAGFAPTWTDTGTGAAGYSAVYYMIIQGPSAMAYYVGPSLTFTATNLLDFSGAQTALPPGTYTATLIGFSGFAAAASGQVSQSNNITGVGLSGQAFSSSTAPAITFTLQ